MLELGGNIKLEGFHDIEPAKLVVIKKIVGNHVKNVDGSSSRVNLLHLVLNENTNNNIIISGKIDVEGKIQEAKAKDTNLFFALNKVLKDLE